VSLWLNLELVATAVLGVLWFRDHLGRGGWLATAGVVASGVWLALEEGPAGWSAAALVAAACVCWGVDNHLTALIDELTPSQSTFCKGLFAGCFNLGLAAFLGQSWPGPGTAGLALGVGAVAYGASVALYVAGAQQLGATRAQLFFATAPFFGAALSWLALGEALTPTHAWTALILAGSLALLFADRHEHRHHHPALEHEHSHRHDDGHHTHTHPGLDPRRRHSHRHRHEPIAHAHPHWPDLHHRHRHGEESGG
jgi:drug/metabolite transporter (DMT)-like permease